MITVPKKFNQQTNAFEPDIPQIWLDQGLVESIYLLSNSDEYNVIFFEGLDPTKITCLQGRRELKHRNLFNQVEALVNASQNDELISMFTNLAVNWHRDTPAIIKLANQLSVDLDDFFLKAKLQSTRLWKNRF